MVDPVDIGTPPPVVRRKRAANKTKAKPQPWKTMTVALSAFAIAAVDLYLTIKMGIKLF